MPLSDVQQILHDATETLQPDTAPSILSAILHVFLRERSRPLDPDYISNAACAALLSQRPELYALLENAVNIQQYSGLWECDALAFRDNDLRTRRPYYPSEQKLERELADFLHRHRGTIATFARSPSPTKPWSPLPPIPPGTSTPTDDFISALHIPDTSSERPCLLLHDLGVPEGSGNLRQRINNIFRPQHHTLFINASGTGKTRLIFEGLSQHWGFYIPSVYNISTYIGSQDMHECLTNDMSPKRKFQPYPPWTKSTFDKNSWVTRNTVLRLLLSRLILLKAFLDELEDTSALESRRRWLLFQALTSKHGPVDLFEQVTAMVDEVPEAYVKRMLDDFLLDVKARCDGPSTNLFCVLDDAERANKAFSGAFGAESSALREIARAWENHQGITLILAGTNVWIDPFLRDGNPEYRICTDTGAFDTPESQRAYVTRYLPPHLAHLANSTSTRGLLHPMWQWLRGRYHFTEGFVAALLTSRFEQPLVLLKRYISYFATISLPRATMSELDEQLPEFASDAVFLQEPFRSLIVNEDRQLFFAAQYALLNIMLQGEDRVRLTELCYRLVARELSIFVDHSGTEAVICEPCVVLPLVEPVFREPGVVNGFYPDELASTFESPPSYGTYHLAFIPVLVQALKENQYRLCDLFTFPGGGPDWATQTAELVRVKQKNGKLYTAVFSNSFSAMKRDDVWATDSSAWLQHETSAPFCLSSDFSNAELIFVMRLSDGRSLYVVLTTVFKSAHVDPPLAGMQARLSRMTPNQIFRTGQSKTSNGLRFGDLPNPVKEAGVPPVLRLVATFPFDVDVNDLKRGRAKQPIATVNTSVLRDYASSFTVEDIVRRLTSVMTAPRKVDSAKRKQPDTPPSDDAEAQRYRTRSVTKKLSDVQDVRRSLRLVPIPAPKTPKQPKRQAVPSRAQAAPPKRRKSNKHR
ncbi:hypothetical protein EV714DRAFT_213614 [Schizophyllum commune]